MAFPRTAGQKKRGKMAKKEAEKPFLVLALRLEEEEEEQEQEDDDDDYSLSQDHGKRKGLSVNDDRWQFDFLNPN